AQLAPLAWPALSTEHTISYNLAKSWSSGDIGGEEMTFEISFLSKGALSGCGASASGTGSVKVSVDSAQSTVSGGGSAAANFNWQINPETCTYEFKSATFDLQANAAYTLKDAAARILQRFPNPATIAAGNALEAMRVWLMKRGVKMENSVGVSAAIGLTGFGWTHPPAPIPLRKPDTWGRDVLTVGINMGIALRTRGSEEQKLDIYKEDFDLLQGGFQKTHVNSAFAQGTNGTGNYYGFEGNAQVQATVELYPSPHLREVKPSGEFKISYAPYFTYAYAIKPDPWIADHAAPQTGCADLPDGWAFNYSPQDFVGSTNVYGTNAVLANVGADTWDDGEPSLAQDGNGRVFLAWSRFGDPFATNAGSQVYVADYRGSNWTDPVALTNSLGFNSGVTAAADGYGQRLVVWAHGSLNGLTTNISYCGFNALRSSNEVCYAVYDGANWSAPAVLAPTPGLDAQVQVCRLAGGDLLAAWVYTDISGNQHLVTSRWDGRGWSTLAEIAAGTLSDPTIQGVGTSLQALWTVIAPDGGRSLYSAHSSGGAWSAPAPFVPALLAAPATLPLAAQPKDIPGLEALNFIDESTRKACCKCNNGVQNTNLNKDLHCGIASVEYDYELCLRKYTYQPCQDRPQDPNNIVGPTGYGLQGWVPAASPLAYTVQFENDPVLASAPAKTVTVTVPLDPHLDPRTFRLGGFGFGGDFYPVPANTAFFQTNIDLVATKGYLVNLIAGIDVVNRQGFWTFSTIDPLTGTVPLNVLLGFLPPDQSPPEGEGFVTFAVTPYSNVTNASPVTEKATIVFDNQPPMDTPYANNLLQLGLPMSSVQPLPSVTRDPAFDVAWQGQETGISAGITSYDIYVSRDGGIYYPWLQGTTSSHAPFLGERGSTYAFYSLAYDNLGNVQPVPAGPDTVTFVSTNLPPVLMTLTNPYTAYPNRLFSLRLRATDPNGDQVTFALLPSANLATVKTTNGVFNWLPGMAQAETTNVFTIVVTDNGAPPQSVSNQLVIVVGDYLALSLGATNVQAGQSAGVALTLQSTAGVTNLVLGVRVPPGSFTNWNLTDAAAQVGTMSLIDQQTNLQISLSANAGQVLSGTQELSHLNFTALPGGISGMLP
ncbi:MAG TPA: sialidase family protein, partial [Verrucomicrobiae bacterium]